MRFVYMQVYFVLIKSASTRLRSKVIMLYGEDEEDIPEEGPECQQLDNHVITYLSHMHSINGNNRSRTFRVTRSIGSTEVGVLKS